MWVKVFNLLNCHFFIFFIFFIGIPLVTRSDPGSENYGIANAHTALRHWHDPSLVGTVQHRWMRSKKNVKPEITWSQLRRRFTPGFENILERGVTEGLYDISHPLDMWVLYYFKLYYSTYNLVGSCFDGYSFLLYRLNLMLGQTVLIIVARELIEIKFCHMAFQMTSISTRKGLAALILRCGNLK